MLGSPLPACTRGNGLPSAIGVLGERLLQPRLLFNKLLTFLFSYKDENHFH